MSDLLANEQLQLSTRNLIEKYKHAQANVENYEMILKEVSDVLLGRSSIRETHETEQFYFRARKGGFDSSDLTQFTVPKPEYVNHGRCNLPRHPVFYVGENPDIAFLEIGSKVGDIVYLTL